MTEIHINNSQKENLIEQLGNAISGEITNSSIEHVFNFDSHIGKGIIRTINFHGGITLLDYDVYFKEEIKLIFKLSKNNPLEFLYISEGDLSYASAQYKNNDFLVKFNRHQNIILSNIASAEDIYIFPGGETVKLNVIQIDSKTFNNNFTDGWQASLKSVLYNQKQESPYLHLGNFNLNLANSIEVLNKVNNDSCYRFLNIEGQLKQLLASQLLDQKNHENKLALPNSISKADLLKTRIISKYIEDNLQEIYTVAELAAMHGMSPKKMQTGFQVLNNKSVNEYIRQKKLEYAMDLIENSEYSISEIVYQIGYKSRSYFSKIFFEAFKILPIEYRDLIKSNQVISK